MQCRRQELELLKLMNKAIIAQTYVKYCSNMEVLPLHQINCSYIKINSCVVTVFSLIHIEFEYGKYIDIILRRKLLYKYWLKIQR
jgi:hypothetical protein